MFKKTKESGHTEVIEGVHLKTLVYGDKTLMTEVKFKKGAVIPPHSHPHEQTGYVISGKLDFLVNGEHREATPGDSWNIPGDVPHGATALEDSIVVEIFSPVREDYLPYFHE